MRLSATGQDASKEIFIGIGPTRDIRAYLAGTAHDVVRDIDFPNEDDVRYRRVPGSASATPPANETFWAVSASGPGTQTIEWKLEEGDWAAVLMNADGSAGVAADAFLGAKSGFVLPLGIGLLAGGAGALLLGVLLVVLGARGWGQKEPPPEGGVPAAAAAPLPVAAGVPSEGAEPAYPVQLEGRLDEPLSRWLWLVKWLLAIPHYIILFFLWIAFAVLTVVAGFAILFTARYPRGLFEFNVGVLRWSWRVAFYTYSALGTDRYPPFSLGPEPEYPATLEIPYPERLSRGLVLVKWWLLAIPQYLVISVFGGGWPFGGWWWASWGGDWEQWNGWHFAWGGGLIGVLVLITAFSLLFRGRYLEGVFGFLVGMNRWIYRVWAYAALMRDEYPPFRLTP